MLVSRINIRRMDTAHIRGDRNITDNRLADFLTGLPLDDIDDCAKATETTSKGESHAELGK